MDTPGMDELGMGFTTLTGAASPARADDTALKPLALFHYGLGGLTALAACSFIFYVVWSLTMLRHPALGPAVPASSAAAEVLLPAVTGYLFAFAVTLAFVGGWTLGALTVFSGRCLQDRKRHTFILVMAALNCVFVPLLGTLLGVCTFVLLMRPSVKALFPHRRALLSLSLPGGAERADEEPGRG